MIVFKNMFANQSDARPSKIAVHTVRSSVNSTGLSLTPYDTHSRLQTHTHELNRPQATRGSRVKGKLSEARHSPCITTNLKRNLTFISHLKISGCYVDNKLYGIDQVIESASGPCLECKCDRSGMMKCIPKECTPEDPLLQQINREVLQSTLSRSQVR